MCACLQKINHYFLLCGKCFLESGTRVIVHHLQFLGRSPRLRVFVPGVARWTSGVVVHALPMIAHRCGKWARPGVWWHACFPAQHAPFVFFMVFMSVGFIFSKIYLGPFLIKQIYENMKKKIMHLKKVQQIFEILNNFSNFRHFRKQHQIFMENVILKTEYFAKIQKIFKILKFETFFKLQAFFKNANKI